MEDLSTTGLRIRRRDGDVRLRTAYADHAEELFRLACRSLGHPGLAEEIVQETFVRAWRAEDRLDAARASVRTWLFVIARNLIVDAARSHTARRLVPVSDGADDLLRALEVEQALAQLAEEHRHVIVEIHYRGRNSADVAAELGVPPAALRTRMFYALKALRLALEEMGWSHGD